MAEVITAVKDIAVGAAAAVTATVAILGFKNWNRELHGKAKFEAARAMAQATYALRDAVAQCRSPWIDGREFSPEYYLPDATAEDKAKGYAHMFDTRLKPVYEAAAIFETRALEAEALWGEPLKNCARNMRSRLTSMRAAMMAIVDNQRSGGVDFTSDPNFAREMRATANGLFEDPYNAFSRAYLSDVDEIEALLKPHLRTQAPRPFFEWLGERL